MLNVSMRPTIGHRYAAIHGGDGWMLELAHITLQARGILISCDSARPLVKAQ